MRNILQNIEVVGATMVYREGNKCKECIDWLCDFCDRVIILLDNYDSITKNIILEYKNNFPDKINIIYSSEPVIEYKNEISGQIKKRLKLRQQYIREQVIVGLKKMHKEKPIDLLYWPDSDEIPINEFPRYLEEFWNNKEYDSMAVGFLEVYDSFKLLISQGMAPHLRVFKFREDMTALPYKQRCFHYPYCNKRPWKVRNLIIHLCHFTEERRAFRKFICNQDMIAEKPREAWILPKDIRKMTVSEIAEYQYGHRQTPPIHSSFMLTDYINNKEKYKDLFKK